MVPITALLLPIVLAAVAVFLASSVAHMVLPHHRRDYKRLPNEEQAMEVMRGFGIQPGTYLFPCPESAKEMGSPEMLEKYRQGPVGLMTVLPTGPPRMGKNLSLWFLYCLVMGLFVAYLTSRTVAPGTDYLAVFRVAGTAAFLAYGGGHAQNSIWRGESWGTTARHVFDSLVYGLLTAGCFGWLWPR